jgi:hypothetical protein
MNYISINENVVTVKKFMGKPISLALDSLRLVYIFFPGTFKWYVVTSKQDINGYNIDALIEEKIPGVFGEFKKLLENKRNTGLRDVKICLADYNNQSVMFDFKDLKASKVDFFEALLRFRKDRLEKLKKWLATTPEVKIKGGRGQDAYLGQEGFRDGKKFVNWKEVATIQIVEKNFGVSDLLVIPKGVSTGMYGFKKYKYSVGNISTKKKELYIAECNFWRTLSAEQDNIDEKLKELAEMRDQGILSEQKFSEAKKKILVEI